MLTSFQYLKQDFPIEIFVMKEIFCVFIFLNDSYLLHMFLSTWNTASVNEKLNFKLYVILINWTWQI